jgi:hypothetical protein
MSHFVIDLSLFSERNCSSAEVGDVLATIRAVFVVGVEGETLEYVRTGAEMQIGNLIRHLCAERGSVAYITGANSKISFCC